MLKRLIYDYVLKRKREIEEEGSQLGSISNGIEHSNLMRSWKVILKILWKRVENTKKWLKCFPFIRIMEERLNYQLMIAIFTQMNPYQAVQFICNNQSDQVFPFQLKLHSNNALTKEEKLYHQLMII